MPCQLILDEVDLPGCFDAVCRTALPSFYEIKTSCYVFAFTTHDLCRGCVEGTEVCR
ncbi:hypothetical protein HMPREF1248_0972 [Coriobacteriaceae bacterium BV3Ac1]|nr:hypothetical protein HMPREF1248_0972 [Coriobacteriaceae bacterium BV3Ac1]